MALLFVNQKVVDEKTYIAWREETDPTLNYISVNDEAPFPVDDLNSTWDAL